MSTISDASWLRIGRKVLLVVLVPLLSWDAGASVLLNYGSSNYVAADTTYARSATVAGSSGNYTLSNSFSDTVALSPSSGYSGPVFYGGYLYTITSTSNTTTGITRQQIRNDVARDGTNSYDLIYLQDYNASGWTGATFSLSAVYVFKLDSVSSVSSISAAVSNSSTNTDFKAGVSWRWVIKVGETYYVSESTFTNTGWATSTVTLSSLSSTNWATYTPTTNLNFDQNSATYAAIDTSSVSAVGLYLEDDSWAGDSGQQSFDVMIQGLTVTGTAIPEPKVGMFLFFGSMGYALWMFGRRFCVGIIHGD